MTRWCESTPRTASWKPQPIASSGTSKFSNTFVWPLRTRSSAFSTKWIAIAAEERLLVDPVLVVRAAEQDADAEVDVDEVVGDEPPVDHHAGGHEHLVP